MHHYFLYAYLVYVNILGILLFYLIHCFSYYYYLKILHTPSK